MSRDAGNSRRSGSHRGAGRGARDRAPRIEISPARLVAYDLLRDVDDRDAYANLALPARIREAHLDGRDAGLATELAAGALRGRGRYDRIIELAAGRPIGEIDGRTRNVLRLGAHQLLSMRTAAHAAVNESVELQRRVANANAAGFVNGVLRTIGRSTAAEWDDRITAEAASPDDALAARTSHPAWVLRALRDALRSEGRETELEALLEADNVPPRVSAVVLPGWHADVRESESTSDGEVALTATGPSPTGWELAGGDPLRALAALGLPDGVARVQDQGSQLAALALTRVRPVAAGERWLDLCAGPGGKTALLGAEARLGGAHVRANEVSSHRAELVRRATEAVADTVEVVSHDGRDDEAYGPRGVPYDRILVDAPCSGLGALRRRPEARWRKQPTDLPSLTALQGELLDAAVAHLAPGGVLAYVTCSPHLAETRVTVDRLLKRHPELRELDARAVVSGVARGELDLAGSARSVQLWPHRHGTDAMFIALLERGD
ncbi:rRNA small subunit methyltransferase B [Leucobacter rhizosphaerae]|uniref:rRNA small subunit methyltransferase B n=1 Tax=Leucobacter rhizosphaerae TaxID=2932245 RepID=A0ABY4FXP4_9MICO|nr:transcription antitermination factor NusB [Leucobacter rhizosphaerae]UOQ61078.1 rRNA small subunit methyltransferase B [Leucobacter rhizosphaerae]